MDDMLPILMIACASSSSCASSFSLLGGGGAAFAAWRSRQQQGETPAPAPKAMAPVSSPAPKRVPRRRPRRRPRRAIKKIFRKPGRAIKKIFRKPGRAIKKIFRKPGRAIKKIFRKPRFRSFKKRKAVKRIGRRFKRIGRRFKRRKAVKRIGRSVKRIFRRRCFAPETPVKLLDGRIVSMKNLKLGDVLVNGSIVKATMQIRNEDDPYYKLPGDIFVTGSHYIQNGNSFVRVSKFNGASHTDRVDAIVSCLITSDHRIPVGDYVFWDWEDNNLVT